MSQDLRHWPVYGQFGFLVIIPVIENGCEVLVDSDSLDLEYMPQT